MSTFTPSTTAITNLRVRPALARLVAAVATLGLGGALGYEGPSVYAGATIGERLERRLPRMFATPGRQALLVAGAAAGVAAIFKAPATGAVFALEVPYQDDLARRSLLPALIGAASGYLTYVAIIGTTPLFTVAGRPPFDLRDLGGAARHRRRLRDRRPGLRLRCCDDPRRSSANSTPGCACLSPARSWPRCAVGSLGRVRRRGTLARAPATTRCDGRWIRRGHSGSSLLLILLRTPPPPPHSPAAASEDSSFPLSSKVLWSGASSAVSSAIRAARCSRFSASPRSSAPATEYRSPASCSSPKRPDSRSSSFPASSPRSPPTCSPADHRSPPTNKSTAPRIRGRPASPANLRHRPAPRARRSQEQRCRGDSHDPSR